MLVVGLIRQCSRDLVQVELAYVEHQISVGPMRRLLATGNSRTLRATAFNALTAAISVHSGGQEPGRMRVSQTSSYWTGARYFSSATAASSAVLAGGHQH